MNQWVFSRAGTVELVDDAYSNIYEGWAPTSSPAPGVNLTDDLFVSGGIVQQRWPGVFAFTFVVAVTGCIDGDVLEITYTGDGWREIYQKIITWNANLAVTGLGLTYGEVFVAGVVNTYADVYNGNYPMPMYPGITAHKAPSAHTVNVTSAYVTFTQLGVKAVR